MPARPVGPRAPSRSNSGTAGNGLSPIERPIERPRHRDSVASTASTVSSASEDLTPIVTPNRNSYTPSYNSFRNMPARAAIPIRSLRTTRGFGTPATSQRDRSESNTSTGSTASTTSATSSAMARTTSSSVLPQAYLQLCQPPGAAACACRICERQRRRST